MKIDSGIEEIRALTNQLPKGTQREYFEDIIKRFENGETINPLDVINGMDNPNFKGVDIEGLKKKEAEVNKIYNQWVKK